MDDRHALAVGIAATALVGGVVIVWSGPTVGWLLMASVIPILLWGWWPRRPQIPAPRLSGRFYEKGNLLLLNVKNEGGAADIWAKLTVASSLHHRSDGHACWNNAPGLRPTIGPDEDLDIKIAVLRSDNQGASVWCVPVIRDGETEEVRTLLVGRDAAGAGDGVPRPAPLTVTVRVFSSPASLLPPITGVLQIRMRSWKVLSGESISIPESQEDPGQGA
jgi:hypothetical protein